MAEGNEKLQPDSDPINNESSIFSDKALNHEALAAENEMLRLRIATLEAAVAKAEERALKITESTLHESGEKRRALVEPTGAGFFILNDQGQMSDGKQEYTRLTQALRTSEAKYRRLFESVRDAFAVVDMGGHIIEFNAALEELTGYSSDELRCLTYVDLTPPRWHELEERIVREQVMTRGYSDIYEKEYRRKDGNCVPIELRTLLVRDDDGQPAAMWAFIRDISDRLKSLEEMQKLATVVHHASELINLATMDGQMLFLNEAGCLMLGLSPEEVTKTNIMQVIPDSWKKIVQQELLPALAAGGTWKGDLQYQNLKNRQLIEVYATTFTVKDPKSGEPIFLANVSTDITERKRAEAEVRASDLRKSEFIGMLSHELRNPLASIHQSLYLLKQVEPGSPPSVRALERIERQTEHLTKLIEDLLDLTRMTYGRIKLRREDLNLNELALKVVEDLRFIFIEKEVSLELRSSSEEVWVNGDCSRLTQIIGNMLHNSAKFTPAGGQCVIEIEADRPQSEAVLIVRDTGIGIAPELKSRLFLAFSQSEMPIGRRAGGLGLGLVLIKHLIELHDGSVSFDSEGVGRGTAFTIRLPLGTSRARLAAAPSAIPNASGPRLILLIEDNIDAAACMREALELHGHSVVVTYDGQTGIEAARTHHPDVVLCDIGLPGMDGYEVARILRADPVVGTFKLIALTGYARTEDVERAKAAGFDAHLAKPASIDVIVRAIA